MKKFTSILAATGLMLTLSSCAYQAMFEDIAGGDSRVATYQFNPFGLKPGTGIEVNPTLLQVITEYNSLLNTYFPTSGTDKVHESIISGGRDDIMAQWSVYSECILDTGLYKQIDTLYFSNAEAIAVAKNELVNLLLKNGWVMVAENELVKNNTGIVYTNTYLTDGDFTIHLLPGNDPNTVQIVFETNGCLELNNLPEGEVIKSADEPFGVWKYGNPD